MYFDRRILASAIIIAEIIVLGMIVLDNWTVSPPPGLDPYCDRRGPATPDELKPELVTLTQVQVCTSYEIPLPDGYSVREIWVSKGCLSTPLKSIPRTLTIVFDGDLKLDLKWEGIRPAYERIIFRDPAVKRVLINGIAGFGIQPGFTLREALQKAECAHRGRVTWWVNKLQLSLESETLSLKELLSIARTVQQSDTAPTNNVKGTPKPFFVEGRDEQ